MQWPGGWSKHITQWLGCGNSIPRYVFPLSKAGALGGPSISRDMKKDCGKPGCPNDHRSEVLSGGDKVIEQERRLPLLARLRHADCFSQCPLLEEDRKCSAHGQNDAIDPCETCALQNFRSAN
jgi:hypothetical protein